MKFGYKIIFSLQCIGLSLVGASSFTNTTDYKVFPEFRLEDVKKLPIISCSDDSQCPDYSRGCTYDYEIDIGVCDMDFFCNKINGCVSILESFDSANSPNLIIDSYQTVKDDKNKNLPKCKSNSDCFTNQCSEGICLVDDSDPIYNCVVAELGVHQSHINCALASNQICYDDLDCISNQCFDVCEDNYYNHNSGDNISSQSFAKAIIYFLLILSLVLN
ncbi:hypothetical protein BCR36DRAFT_411815 [Piromyces finnis]|uniref:Uncharacterized protein n=1 Tax=Piromyces finnis TaxID=1754191 RepID=A0A1Y1VBM6_9FUNG|nr:hypothetical protein BCR36DRAFT_411815 [Piromyces finnis]|eukprot:ORX51865.1 hypothetical protein BCR36DRAFT_411815 [Piromyces finnis]